MTLSSGYKGGEMGIEGSDVYSDIIWHLVVGTKEVRWVLRDQMSILISKCSISMQLVVYIWPLREIEENPDLMLFLHAVDILTAAPIYSVHSVKQLILTK